MRSHGFGAQRYPSGDEFLASLASGLPQCLILHLRMPDMTGLELKRELSRLGYRIPTILVTAEDAVFRDSWRALGIAAWLSKPVDEDRLLSAIASAMRQKN